jgi:RIO kinase 1
MSFVKFGESMSKIIWDDYEEAPDSGVKRVYASRKKSGLSICKENEDPCAVGREFDDLDFFMQEEIISSRGVLLKPGKEAVVYRCPGKSPRINGEVAVKIYKDAERRSFQSLNGYLENRLENAGLKRRDLMHVMGSPSSLLGIWVGSEFSMLNTLHKAGVPVPKPYLSSANAVAMEFVGADEAAPRLRNLNFSKSQGDNMLEQILAGISLMLECHVVHADLSPYNILVRENKPVFIDFPQAIDPRFNSQAPFFLERDLGNILRFFSGNNGTETAAEAKRIAEALWKKYG